MYYFAPYLGSIKITYQRDNMTTYSLAEGNSFGFIIDSIDVDDIAALTEAKVIHNCKARQHSKRLTKSLEAWQNGQYEALKCLNVELYSTI